MHRQDHLRAKTGTFTTPKARRIRELTRYDGKKWIY